MTSTPLLHVRSLRVLLETSRRGSVRAVDGVDLALHRGEVLGVVGESGSGKSMLANSILRLEPKNAILSGEIIFDGVDLTRLSQRSMQRLRGTRLGMVFQDPMTTLNPVFTVGNQLMEAVAQHRGLSGAELRREAIERLDRVRLSSPEERLKQYPHQMSGGMRQRAVSAIAQAGEPDLLIADEPTTALDVTTQDQYLRMLSSVQRATETALIFISHDLRVVRRIADRVLVMYAGQVVESGEVDQIMSRPEHPYTRGLIGSLPRQDRQEMFVPIPGQPPDPTSLPAGCRFAPRCPHVRDVCEIEVPPLEIRGASLAARCWGTSDEGWIA